MANLIFSASQTMIFIKLYQAHECLWNSNNDDYWIKSTRESAYRSFVNAFSAATGVTLATDQAKMKVKSYRTQFSKELALLVKLQTSGTGKLKFPRYVYFRELMFLLPVMGTELSATTLNFLQNEPRRTSRIFPDCVDLNRLPTVDIQLTDVSSLTDMPLTDIPLKQDVSDSLQNRDYMETVSSDSSVPGGVESDRCEVVFAPSTLSEPVKHLKRARRKTLQQKNKKRKTIHTSSNSTCEDVFKTSDGISKEDALFTSIAKFLHTSAAECEKLERSRQQEERLQQEIDRLKMEEREKNEEMNRSMVIWARGLANDIESIKNDRKRQLVRLQINKLVNEALMEELE